MARALTCGLILAWLGACSGEGRREQQNLLLICVDTLRADRLGLYGQRERAVSPNLDRLAERSIVFEDAASAAGWTKPSVPTFLTGTYPLQHGVYEGDAKQAAGATSDVLPQEAETLAERLGAAGWQSAAFVQNAQLKRGLGFEQGFDTYADQAGDAREIRWKALDWLTEHEARPAPFFLYLHLLDVHWPYDVPVPFATSFAPDAATAEFRGEGSRALRQALNDGQRTLTEEERSNLVALYDGAVRYVDHELGLLFDELERRGLWEDTIVCVIADHGEEFLEHGRVGHGHGLWQNLLRVPWILYVPGERPRRVAEPVALVDLLPTLLSALDVPSGAASVGAPRLAATPPRPVFAEHKDRGSYLQSFRTGSKKLLRRFTPRPDAKRETDPLSVFRPGSRWEAECELAGDSTWRAVQLRPREESLDEPTEIKGAVSLLAGQRFELSGVPVELGAECEFYGELTEATARGAMLTEGLGVKARGAFEGECFIATKIKIYPAREVIAPEIRGTLSDVSFAGTDLAARIGGWPIVVSESAEWELEQPSAELARGEIQTLARLGGEGARKAGFGVEVWLFDLLADPNEQRPIETGADVERLSAELDAFVRGLAQHALDHAQPAALDRQDVLDLRAIGYAE